MATTTTAMPDDINARNKRGQTKIFLAAEAGNAAEVARLLQLKADFELPANYKYLSLFNDKKLFINLFNLFQHSNLPLHIACLRGHAPVVRLLLKAGANTDAENFDRFVCYE